MLWGLWFKIYHFDFSVVAEAVRTLALVTYIFFLLLGTHSWYGGSSPPYLMHPLFDPACPTFLKSLFPLLSFLFHLLFRPGLMQPTPVLIRPTNLPYFKQISKG